MHNEATTFFKIQFVYVKAADDQQLSEISPGVGVFRLLLY